MKLLESALPGHEVGGLPCLVLLLAVSHPSAGSMAVYLKPVTITRLVKSAITARGPSLGRDRERHLWGGPGGLFVAFGDGEVSGGVRGGV